MTPKRHAIAKEIIKLLYPGPPHAEDDYEDWDKLYTKKQKALYRGAFRIGNHPCFDKKFRNTDGVHFGTGSGTRTHTPHGRGT